MSKAKRLDATTLLAIFMAGRQIYAHGDKYNKITEQNKHSKKIRTKNICTLGFSNARKENKAIKRLNKLDLRNIDDANATYYLEEFFNQSAKNDYLSFNYAVASLFVGYQIIGDNRRVLDSKAADVFKSVKENLIRYNDQYSHYKKFITNGSLFLLANNYDKGSTVYGVPKDCVNYLIKKLI